MFSPYCPRCRSEVLLGARRIIRIATDDDVHRVHLRCLCGDPVVSEVPAASRQPRQLRGAA
jgi:hypothetical protein